MSRTPAQPGGGAPGAPRVSGPPAAKPAPAKPAAAAPARPSAAAPNGARPGTAATAPAVPASAPAAGATPAKPGASIAAYLRKPGVIKYGSAIAGVVLVIVLLVWRPWVPTPPRLNEDPAKIAKFAASHLNTVPFEHQRQLMEVLDEKDQRVVEAYEQGMLSDQEFRRVLQLEWYGEHLKKMDKFYAKPPQLRALYLDSQIDKNHKKKAKKKHEPKPDAKSPVKAEEIDRDDSTEEQDIKKWPADVRQRWADYRAAVASRKQYWKDQKEQRKTTEEAKKNGQPQGSDAKATDAPPAPAGAPTAATPTDAAPPGGDANR
jgi:hypothetical protein